MNRYWITVATFAAGLCLELAGSVSGWMWLDFLGSLAQGAAFGAAIGVPSWSWIDARSRAVDVPAPRLCACGHDAVFHGPTVCFVSACACRALERMVVDAQPVQDVMPTITGQKRAGGQW